jgi:hypothetical protein
MTRRLSAAAAWAAASMGTVFAQAPVPAPIPAPPGPAASVKRHRHWLAGPRRLLLRPRVASHALLNAGRQ